MENRSFGSYMVCLVFAFLVKQHYAAPAQNVGKENIIYEEIEHINQKSSKKLFEGDIVPSWFEEEVETGTYTDSVKRESKRLLRYIWRTRVIPYEISAEYVQSERDSITSALTIFEQKTCLKFMQHSNETHWIKFAKMDGCFSSVGRCYWRPGFQTISLADGCLSQSTILHEVMHSIGFWHEQSRPDRDKFVEILWENIVESEKHNFKKYSHLEADNLNVNYDYQTMMHYGRTAFSKNGEPTIKAIGNGDLELGTSPTLSASDIIQINALYDCQSKGISIWSRWSSFSPCDAFCDKRRRRFCSHADLTHCTDADEHGIVIETVKCTEAECNAPVDGNWGQWSLWGVCYGDCGKGKKNRTRQCNDPPPKNGGQQCQGESTLSAECFLKSCGLGENDCEFEAQGWCMWKKDPDVFSRFQWNRDKGSTPSSNTGPNGDHSFGTGHYLYVEASSPAKPGDKARIISKELSATNGVCLSFWYHMHGLTMGNLRVFIRNSNGVETEVLKFSGDKGDQWLNANKTITSETPFKVIFEAENGQAYLSDMALDDIKFQNGKCEKSSIEIKCGVNAKSLGCYAESSSNRVMPKLLDSHRDAINGHKNFMIEWNNYPKSVETLLCHCAQRAKANGYKYFALQYYAECWSGPGEIDYKKYGESSQCVDEQYHTCANAQGEPCAGGNNANYVYEIL